MSRLSSELTASLEVSRFSTQLLQQSGAQKEIRQADGKVVNQYTLSRGNEMFADPTAVSLSSATLEKGAFSNNVFSAVRGYFESRGASRSNADVMASLTMDVAKTTGRSPMTLLDYNSTGSTSFDTEIMNFLNRYRPRSQQQDVFSDTNNKKSSLKSRSIRA